jgi:hypothetical protein
MIGQGHSQAYGQFHWQRFSGTEQDGPILLIAEQIGKSLAKGLHQPGAAVEEDGAIIGPVAVPTQPNGAPTASRLSEVRWLTPLESFH